MSGGLNFGVPIKMEGITDITQGLINIQRSLSDLFSTISSVVVTTNLIINAAPYLNSGTISPAGTITAANLAAHSVIGNPNGGASVPVAMPIGAGLSDSGGTLSAQWRAGSIAAITAELLVTSGTLDVVAVKGRADGSNPGAGIVGEFISSTVLVGAQVALTSATPANVTSISFTAGDWDVWGNVAFNAAAGTTITVETAAINTTSATLPTIPGAGAYTSFNVGFVAAGTDVLSVSPTRISVSGTTTVYLVAQATFAVSTMGAYGFLGARRRD